jgi:peptidase M1-like protein
MVMIFLNMRFRRIMALSCYGIRSCFLAALFTAIIFSLPTHAVAQGHTINIARERAEGKVLTHKLNVTIDIKTRSINGVDRITAKRSGDRLKLIIRTGSTVDKVESGGVPVDFSVNRLRGIRADAVSIPFPGPYGETVTFDIYFHGAFPSIEDASRNIKRGVAFVDDGVIGDEGVFLPSSALWYPQEETGLPLFEISIDAPAGFTSVTEGQWLESLKEKERAIDRWKTEKPLQGLDLVTCRYFIEKLSYKGIDIYTFFFEKEDALSKTYIDKTKGYLDLYQNMIGPYPFRKFAVVENFLPTGYGMPSFTLLGSTVLRLPFIPDTSLGHEIAHNWWGNSVFVDDSLGNWSEAITTYTADYLFAGRSGEKEAIDFRLNKLRGYKNFAGDHAIALRDFVDSTTPASRAVGYDKGMMVFNMLERLLGPVEFNRCLKELYRSQAFKPTTWLDIQSAFERSSGKNLKWFFDEWVVRAGAPAIAIDKVTLGEQGKIFKVSFDIRQSGPAYIMDIPVVFDTRSGKILRSVRIDKSVQKVSFDLDSRPSSFELDPGHEVFRLLSDDETPPTLASFFGDKVGVIVIPASAKEKYSAPAEFLSGDYNITFIADSDPRAGEYLKERSVFIFGGPEENRLFPRMNEYMSRYLRISGDSLKFLDKSYGLKNTILVFSMKNPNDKAKTICFLFGDADKEKIARAARRIRYFTQYSYLIISDEKLEKGTFQGKMVLRHEF